MIRRLIRSTVETRTEWEICGEAKNGAEALLLVREHPPDLIILDLIMPVMDGLEAARRIAKISPAIPILMFTMQNSGQMVKEAYAAGVREVLSKSDAGTDRLITSMRSLLNQPAGIATN